MSKIINFNFKLKNLLKEAQKDFFKDLIIKKYLEKKLEEEKFLKELFDNLRWTKVDFHSAKEKLWKFLLKEFGDIFDGVYEYGKNLGFRGYFNLPDFENFVKVVAYNFGYGFEVYDKIIEEFKDKKESFWRELIDNYKYEDYLESIRKKRFFSKYKLFREFYDLIRKYYGYIPFILAIRLKVEDEKSGVVFFEIGDKEFLAHVSFPYIYNIECIEKELFNIFKDKNEREVFLSNFISFLFKYSPSIYEEFSVNSPGELENEFFYYVFSEISKKRFDICVSISEEYFSFWEKFAEIFKNLRKKLIQPQFLFDVIWANSEKAGKIKNMIKKAKIS